MGSQRPSREHRGEVRRRYEHPEARRSGVFAFLEAVCYNRYRTNVCRRRAEERRRSIMEHNFQQLLYTTAEENQNINAILKDESIWMTQKSMAELFGVGVPAINKHLSNIFEEGELEEQATISILEIVQQEGTRKVKRPVTFYNLDAIISVGYRVNSKRATNFRIWATGVLKDYIQKGFALDDDRLKNLGGGDHWKELLDRIRDIRSSEKVLYRQVLDLYATSEDYDPKTPVSREFFKIVQNKLHYATHGHTAAEVIFERADAELPFMGMTSFNGSYPTAKDIVVAKNYLSEKELKVLNNLVSGYFDIAELNAIEHRAMYMEDHVRQLDAVLSSTGRSILTNAGTVSHEQALAKAKEEYQKYQQNNLSPVERDYISTIKQLAKTSKENG